MTTEKRSWNNLSEALRARGDALSITCANRIDNQKDTIVRLTAVHAAVVEAVAARDVVMNNVRREFEASIEMAEAAARSLRRELDVAHAELATLRSARNLLEKGR